MQIKYEREVPDYADVFTIEEFEAACRSHCFTDYDGSGNYVRDGELYESVCCKSIANGEIDHNYTHVAWFNK